MIHWIKALTKIFWMIKRITYYEDLCLWEGVFDNRNNITNTLETEEDIIEKLKCIIIFSFDGKFIM